MQLKPEQLSAHLKQQLLPVYLITGDEPLQGMEAAEQIRLAAQKRGFSAREVLSVDAQFDWGVLYEAANALSLFAEQKILDLRLNQFKPGQSGSKALQAYTQHLPSDKILLIQCARLDKAQRSSVWVKAIEKHGAVITIWDLSPQQTLEWVGKRMQTAGLKAKPEAVRYLSECVEGNLLAAQQEINKLKLLFADEVLDVKHIATTVMDNARYSVFDLSDAILHRDVARIQHVLQVLENEDIAMPLVVWSIADVLRQSYDFVHTGEAGRATPMRRELLQRQTSVLRRLPWVDLFAQLARLEKHSKGVGLDAPRLSTRLWEEAQLLALACAGINTIKLNQE